MNEPQSFGNVLRRYRMAAGLTQEGLAEQAGLSARAITDLERGVRRFPYPDTVERLARTLGLDETRRAELQAASRRPVIDRRIDGGSSASVRGDPSRERLPAMVSREAELRRVLSIVDDVVTNRRGRVVLLDGEPGVGKSRLAAEVVAEAAAGQARALVGRCFAEHAAVPFLPFAEMFAAALEHAPAKFRTEAFGRWPELAYVISADHAGGGLNGHATQLQVFRAAAAFLGSLAEAQPLVLLIEDAHWADSTSLGLLLHLGRYVTRHGLVVLVTYRDSDVPAEHALGAIVRDLVRERVVEHIHLNRLGLDGTAALLRSRLPDDVISEDLARQVHARAQGNPFFTEELLAAFLEQRVAAATVGSRKQDDFAGLAVPRSVQSVIHERVARLPQDAQEVLRVACVLGQEFDLQALLAGCDRPEAAVFSGLDMALAHRLLDESGGGDLERYAFVHALIQESLYQELPGHRRRRLHLRLGEALEALPASKRRPAELARHFLAAGASASAQRYSVEAGDEAAARYAHPEAIAHYRAALEVFARPGEGHAAREAQVQLRLAAELLRSDRKEEALAACASALRIYRLLGDSAGEAEAQRHTAWCHQRRHDFARARPHLEEALRLWPHELEDSSYALLLADAARVHTYASEYSQAANLADQCLAVSERLGDKALQARALVELSLARLYAGQPNNRVLPHLDRAEALSTAAGDKTLSTRIYLNRGWARQFAGDSEGCRADERQAVMIAEAAGLPFEAAFAGTYGVWACMDLGRWEDGRELATRTRCETLTSEPGAALVAWLCGHFSTALALLHDRIRLARERNDILRVYVFHALIADFQIQLGHFAEATTAARFFMGPALDAQTWGEMGVSAGPLVEALARVNAPDAPHALARARERVDELQHEHARPALLRAEALLRQQSGDLEPALDCLKHSAVVARAQGAAIELGRSLVLMADLARDLREMGLAEAADAERAAIIERIGPEVRGLVWAANVPAARVQS